MKITFDRLVIVLIIALAGVYVAKYFYHQPQFVNGQKALDFSAQTIGQETFQLSKLQGNYVLLDFWGSWCGPCRMENANWVALHNRLDGQTLAHAKGFHIVSIGVETSEENWKRAIAYDGLNWPLQILDKGSSLKFFNSPLARLYKIRALPSNYLINPKGIIVGVNVSPEAVEKIVTK